MLRRSDCWRKQVSSARALPANTFVSTGFGRIICFSPGSRTTFSRRRQPWGRHELVGISVGGGGSSEKGRVISMRPGNFERKRGRCRAAGLIISAAMLSGCSLASSVGSSDSSPSFASRFASLFSSATPGVTQPHSPTPSAPDVECPGVDIRTGASTMNIAARATDATAGDLRYQLSFGQTARECAVQGATLIIKVGVQGRVILGPMGSPGQVEVPLRYAVVREGPQPKTVV